MLKKQQFISLIRQNDFQELFITELGWNHYRGQSSLPQIIIDDVAFDIETIAIQKGFQILVCDVDEIPSQGLARKIDTKLRRQAADYICIYRLRGTSHHLWVVPVRTNEKRELVLVEYEDASKADFLYSKIDGFSFEFGEETNIVDIRAKVQGVFAVNSEKITKDFYFGFRKQHKAFAEFISGIDDEIETKSNHNKQWYASVMLNRLMFCYFIQKKGFLNFDHDYLRHKLQWVQQEQGENRFFKSFYRGFLTQLFHGGLNSPKHNREFESVYGKIPYLNGGMFDEHQLERDYADIDINDEAFVSLFDFFDTWRWHLDTRITASGKDINPDVLGYIFEQYINDRAQMGAYYTKEDITEYIGKNCIVPFLLDKVAASSPAEFTPEGYVWRMLRESGDRYIYDAVKKGYSPDWKDRIPADIARGLNTTEPNLLERRSQWNTKTDEEFALPTEIWRETVERLARCESVLSKIRNGEITHINDFITYNLDIRLFVADLLEHTENTVFLKQFYHALQSITILDPTCGSGAFLFAAMNILEPLYEICITRMQEFNAKNPLLFKEELREIENKYRSNIQYFIFKSIILRNLYGVDIMVEATEIAKLRLFLKMVAVVEVDKRADNLGLDPLPDIDFNIRCGNTLVGYANGKQLENDLSFAKTADETFANTEFKEKIKIELDKVATAFSAFKEVQFTQSEDITAFKEAKTILRKRLADLNEQLDRRLHKADAPYLDINDWRKSYQPFHWFAEFYEIIQGNGGFDVIIGNPPYVVYSPSKSGYTIKHYMTLECKDLYAFVSERSSTILNSSGKLGLIVPISIVSTSGFVSLRNLLANNFQSVYYSNYAMRPAKLFEGAEKHLSIFIATRSAAKGIYSSKYYRWSAIERSSLFKKLSYVEIADPQLFYLNTVPKLGSEIEIDILTKILKDTSVYLNTVETSTYKLYHTRKLRYFLQFLDCAPLIYNEDGTIRETSELKEFSFENELLRNGAIAVYLSTLFFWFYISMSDCRNLNKREVINFPCNLKGIKDIKELSEKGNSILKNLQENSFFVEANYQKYGRLKMQVFQPRLSKEIADTIDEILSKHYGFSKEELDFIINYDIKYRMGDELNEE